MLSVESTRIVNMTLYNEAYVQQLRITCDCLEKNTL